MADGIIGGEHFADGKEYGIVYIGAQCGANLVFEGVAQLAFGNKEVFCNVLYRQLHRYVFPKIGQSLFHEGRKLLVLCKLQVVPGKETVQYGVKQHFCFDEGGNVGAVVKQTEGLDQITAVRQCKDPADGREGVGLVYGRQKNMEKDLFQGFTAEAKIVLRGNEINIPRQHLDILCFAAQITAALCYQIQPGEIIAGIIAVPAAVQMDIALTYNIDIQIVQIPVVVLHNENSIYHTQKFYCNQREDKVS